MSFIYTPPRSGAALLVAASTALVSSKLRADYVCTGSNDDVTINLALAAVSATGGTVRLSEGTYSTSASLVMYSNTRLIVDPGATVTSSNTNLLKNASTIPSRTVTDAVTTAASATVTSATASFTSGDVGKYVGVVGAGPNYGLSTAPSSLYGTITTVNSSTSITVSVVATLTTSGSTLNVYPARDTNIVVEGGTWNRGNVDSIYQTLNSHGFLFRRVDGLLISSLKHTSTGTNGLGGRYAVAVGDCTKVVADKLDFQTSGDGVHFTGPGQYITVRDIKGTTGDDHVAFTGIDGQSQVGSSLGDVNGGFTDVLVEDIQSNGSWTSLKITGGMTSGNVANSISRFKAKDLSGSVVNGSVNILDYGGATTFTGEIENVNVVTGTNFPLCKLGATNASEVVLRGFKWPNVATPTSGVIQITQNVTSLLIKDMEFLYSGATGGPIILCSTTFLRQLALEPTGTLDLVKVTTASCILSILRITNVFKSGSAGGGNLINCTAGSYNIKAEISDVVNWIGALFTTNSDSTNVLYVTASNIISIGTLFTLQCPATLFLNNVSHTQSSGNAVNAASAAATPVRVYGNNVSLSSGTLFTRSASQALSVMGLTLSTDLSILTPTDQDIVNNSNGALSCGAGLCIFHTGGTGNGWKNIYSGLLY